MELDILVKITDINYTIVGSERLSQSNTTNLNVNINISRDNLLVLVQKSENYKDKKYELSFYTNSEEDNIDKNFIILDIHQFINYLNTTYTQYNHVIFFQNTLRIMEYINTHHNENLNDIKTILNLNGRAYYCVDSILKTITKIPVIIQGRQVLRKYRIPQINQVFDVLKVTNIYISSDTTYNYRYLFDKLLYKIDQNIINNTFISISDQQTFIFKCLLTENIHITSPNYYSGKSTTIYYKIASLIYGGVDVDDIVLVLDKTRRKKIVENFWNQNLLAELGYKIKLLPIENIVKLSSYPKYIIVDINLYNDTDTLDSFCNKLTNNNIVIVVANEYLKEKLGILKSYVINDIEITHNVPDTLSINEHIKTLNIRDDCLYIIDNQLDVEYKSYLRQTISKDNLVSIKKITNELLIGNEFYGVYIFVKSLNNIKNNPLINECYKRSTHEIIIYM
jgi:hypothetical protein